MSLGLVAVVAAPLHAEARAKSRAPAARAAPAPRAAPARPAEPPEDRSATEPVAVALRAMVGGRLKRFYQPRGYWPLWVRSGRIRPEANRLIAMLESADLDGLDPADYGVARLRRRIAAADGGAPEDVARAELELSQAFADYVIAVKRPRSVRMTYLDPELEPRRQREDDVLRLAGVVPDFAAYVRAMGWMDPLYVALRGGLERLVERGGDEETERIARLNLDRARILPGPWVRHVVVDAASAKLYYYGDGQVQGSMRVVVGTAETETPMLAGMVRYAILNPYWNVPTDLVERRIAPKVLGGASLRSLRYEALSDWSANATTLDPATIDWHAVADGSRELRLRQLPGGGNAMGRMKFMFPNDQGIYLHDTPDKQLMRLSARHLSNGCVRLEDAPRLGQWFFGRALSPEGSAPEQIVPLPDPVPVYLTYLTAAPGANGVTILNDAYDRDGRAR